MTVQCAWSPASSRPTVIELSGTLEGDAVCNDGSDEKSVTVTAKPEATLSITAPADNTICANVEKVTADFTYEATNVDGAVSFSWEPTECQKKSEWKVTITCSFFWQAITHCCFLRCGTTHDLVPGAMQTTLYSAPIRLLTSLCLSWL